MNVYQVTLTAVTYHQAIVEVFAENEHEARKAADNVDDFDWEDDGMGGVEVDAVELIGPASLEQIDGKDYYVQ